MIKDFHETDPETIVCIGLLCMQHPAVP